MKCFRILISLALSLGLVATAAAQAPFKIGTGGPKGTYYAMCMDMLKTFGAKVPNSFSCEETNGSMDNMQRVIARTLQGAVVQFDVMKYLEEKDPNMAQIKVVFPLHQEEVHLVGANTSYKEGGWFGIGSKSVELKTLKDLNGRKVVAWGGSVLSAEYFAYRFKLNYEVIDVSGLRLDEKGAVVKAAEKQPAAPDRVAAKMVASGEAHAIFAVGGFPLLWLQDGKVFGKQFKMLSIGSDMADQVGGIYNKSKVNYSNLTDGAVATVAVPAVLVTRDFRTPDRVAPIVALQREVVLNLETLRDEGHPKWALPTDPSKKFDRWGTFEAPAGMIPALPAPAPAALPAPAKKK